MSKGYKVKRYRKIYRRPHAPLSIFTRALLTVASVAVLAFIGWYSYGPITAYISSTLETAARPRPSTSSSTASAGNPGEEDAPPPAETSETSAAAAAQALPQVQKTRAVYLPAAMLTDEKRLEDFLARLEESEINAVLFDLKDASGNVLYASSLGTVSQAKAQSETPYDLSALCTKLTDKNLVPIGRLQAFRDPLAASRLEGAGVKYMSSETLWLDDFPQNGGKAWLNPYSSAAQEYVADIAAEAVSLGVKKVVLDNVTFPVGYGLEQASYGPLTASLSKAEVLTSFVGLVEQRVNALGGEMMLYVSGTAALGDSDKNSGVNPLELAGDCFVLGVMPSQFGSAYQTEKLSIEAPILNPYTTVSTLLRSLPTLKDKQVTALVQGYTATGSIENNKVYTAEDISEQLRALGENGIESYILYSPSGDYPTT